jgi:hypothetical protein
MPSSRDALQVLRALARRQRRIVYGAALVALLLSRLIEGR